MQQIDLHCDLRLMSRCLETGELVCQRRASSHGENLFLRRQLSERHRTKAHYFLRKAEQFLPVSHLKTALFDDELHDLFFTISGSHVGENKRSGLAHFGRVPVHHV